MLFLLMCFGPPPESGGPDFLWEQIKKILGAMGILIEQGRGYDAQKYISDIFRQFLEAFMENPHIFDNIR